MGQGCQSVTRRTYRRDRSGCRRVGRWTHRYVSRYSRWCGRLRVGRLWRKANRCRRASTKAMHRWSSASRNFSQVLLHPYRPTKRWKCSRLCKPLMYRKSRGGSRYRWSMSAPQPCARPNKKFNKLIASVVDRSADQKSSPHPPTPSPRVRSLYHISQIALAPCQLAWHEPSFEVRTCPQHSTLRISPHDCRRRRQSCGEMRGL